MPKRAPPKGKESKARSKRRSTGSVKVERLFLYVRQVLEVGRALNHERPFSHLLPLKFAGRKKTFANLPHHFFHLEKLFNLKHVARTKAWGSREEERSRGKFSSSLISRPPPVLSVKTLAESCCTERTYSMRPVRNVSPDLVCSPSGLLESLKFRAELWIETDAKKSLLDIPSGL